MASTEPFAPLLEVTGDAVEEVLDSFKIYYPHVVPSKYPQTIKDIKVLLEVVQKLETESLSGAFRTAQQRAKKNISGVLDECGQLAKLLHNRIKGRNLQDDARTSRDIQTYCAEIRFFLATYSRSRGEQNMGRSQAERYDFEDLQIRYEEAQTEIAKLRSYAEGQAYRSEDDSPAGSPSECCEAKLLHIKSLHEAIACLGMRYPTDHGLDSWEELKGELPSMLDHIRAVNELLRRLEDPETPLSPTSSRASPAHRRKQSEPHNVRSTSFSRDARPRLPSPTESNISVSRDSTSAVGASNHSRKRRSKATNSFWNPGG